MDCYDYITRRNPSKLEVGLQRLVRYKGEDDAPRRRPRPSSRPTTPTYRRTVKES